jgi:hypothetical protein
MVIHIRVKGVPGWNPGKLGKKKLGKKAGNRYKGRA